MPEKYINPNQLCIGLYVRLDVSWMHHSFLSNNFKIRNENQITELKSLGLKQIIYNPDRSDVEPLPLKELKETPESVSPEQPEPDQAMWKEKQSRIKKIKERRVRLNRCTKEYTKTVSSVRNVMRNVVSQPGEAVEVAADMVSEIVGNLMVDQDTTLHLVNMKSKSESAYFHATNVSILALMLGKQLGLDEKQMNLLGTGALFHDLGKTEIPSKVLRKTGPLTKAEKDLYLMHPIYGERLAVKIGTVPAEAIEVIARHHEMMDGSGYPKGLRGEQISDLVQIVSIVNAYDNLCNNINPDKSHTPYEAMSILFTREKKKFDEHKLTTFITNMGVYPPGTVVRLSDDSIASVISINPDALLSPNVMVYDPQIPRGEALIIDLTEEELEITGGVHRSELPGEVVDYLNLSDNINFYFDTASGKKP